MKKKSFVFISVLIILSLLSCRNKDEAGLLSEEAVKSASQEAATLKIFMPGTMSDRMEEFLAYDYKDRMRKELNLEFDVAYLPWNDFFTQIPLMIAAGQQIDWTWHNPKVLMNYYNQGLLLPLDELLDTYGPDIKANIPEVNIEVARSKDGQIAYIPMAYTPTKNKFNSFMVRQDILDSIGVPEINTIEDLEKAAAALNQHYPAMNVLGADSGISQFFRGFYDTPIELLYSNKMIGINLETNKVVNLTEDPAFRELSNTMRKWYENGWISEEVIKNPKDHKARMVSGNYLIIGGGISDPMDMTPAVRKNIPGAVLKEYSLDTWKGMYRVMSATDCSGIPVTAKYPEKVMEWLNWISRSNDNFNFIAYGIEGKDFTIDNNKLNRITMDDLFYPWMFFNHKTMNYPSYMSDEFIETFKTWDDDAIISDIFGLIFDLSVIDSQLEKLQIVYEEYVYPLTTGTQEYDDLYEDLTKASREAGIDEILAELQRQVDDYISR